MQVPKRGVDEFESAQVPALVEEAVDRIEARPARHPAQQRRGNAAAVAAEPVRIALLQALFQSEHGKHWTARLTADCRRGATGRWRFCGAASTALPSRSTPGRPGTGQASPPISSHVPHYARPAAPHTGTR